jgi:hypothetical protein
VIVHGDDRPAHGGGDRDGRGEPAVPQRYNHLFIL